MAKRSLSLPSFIEPMLAKPAKPFDSDKHLFEVKWDGTRALAYIDRRGSLRLMNRRRVEIGDRYPELSVLGDSIAAGTILDGEIVVLDRQGRADFSGMQRREHAQTSLRIAAAARTIPATYMVFDQVYARFKNVMKMPCEDRRALMKETIADVQGSRVVMSEGIVGAGRAYFERAEEMGLEGIVAKRLDSPYLPGRRSDAWQKIKRQRTVACVVIGFEPEANGKRDFRALVLAAQNATDASLACVGKVGTGFDSAIRDRINALLWPNLRSTAVIPCRMRARWVEPVVYCTIRCLERTASGQLRAPVFVELFDVSSNRQ